MHEIITGVRFNERRIERVIVGSFFMNERMTTETREEFLIYSRSGKMEAAGFHVKLLFKRKIREAGARGSR